MCYDSKMSRLDRLEQLLHRIELVEKKLEQALASVEKRLLDTDDKVTRNARGALACDELLGELYAELERRLLTLSERVSHVEGLLMPDAASDLKNVENIIGKSITGDSDLDRRKS